MDDGALALLRQTRRSAAAPTRARELGEAVDAVDLRVEEATLRARIEERAKDLARDVEVRVDVARLKLDLESLPGRVVPDRGHHRRVHGSALHLRATSA